MLNVALHYNSVGKLVRDQIGTWFCHQSAILCTLLYFGVIFN